MTGRETAEMCARLKGASRRRAPAVADATLRAVGLSRLADRPCGEYSGGNRRKLSLATALVGDPRVLLLDEPSSGMCPLGRRMMWDAVERSAAGKTVVLRTPWTSARRCAAGRDDGGGQVALSRIAQHLKEQFGSGYAVDIKVAAAGQMSDANADARVANETFAEMAAARTSSANDRARRREGEGRVEERERSPPRSSSRRNDARRARSNTTR